MKISYDFHIHTAASPCADDYMSPHNIVNMAKLNDLQVIAITDHNTCANCEVVMQIGAENDLLVVPGIEIECMEEFHCIALFRELKAAQYIEAYLLGHMPPIKNRTDIFGYQHIFNANDEVIGEIDRLLLTAASIPAEKIFKEVRGAGGFIYPAHIDRNAYSIISNLGFIPEELAVDTIEVSRNASVSIYQEKYKNMKIIQSSDAHYLQDILQEGGLIEVPGFSTESLFKGLTINCNNKL